MLRSHVSRESRFLRYDYTYDMGWYPAFAGHGVFPEKWNSEQVKPEEESIFVIYKGSDIQRRA